MCFTKVKKNFGFGVMRLPTTDGKVDRPTFQAMVDHFMASGFNYFDTAHVYLNGESERVLRDCLTSRYPREQYVLTNKLSGSTFQKNEDIRPVFQSQLEACGVEYFDFYLMHSQDVENFAKYKACRAYETALELKAEGKIKALGISFHDKSTVLEQILTEYPQVEVVQLQFNYADYEDPAVESRKCYEVCRKYSKPVIVMEPVKGGSLAQLPEDAKQVLDALQGGSPASYAIRFAAGFEGIRMVLSGMSDLEMVKENCGFMKDFRPLDQRERDALDQVLKIMQDKQLIPCTSCRYCMEVCPKGVCIPEVFACVNARKKWNSWNSKFYFGNIHVGPDACVQCGKCEAICPQHLPIRQLLQDAKKEFEKK